MAWQRLSRRWSRPAEIGEPGEHDGGVIRDRFDLIAQHCADMEIPIEWSDLGSHRRGICQVSTGRIVLNERMTRAQATSTLAHEVGHWTFGDRSSAPRLERRAWRYGASLLISARDYAAAEAVVGCHPNSLAAELEVTPKLIVAWREWWSTTC